jgi:pimeloyl-ACP methyl ester carboxylesterase
LVPFLSDRFTCYAFDVVGFGKTTSPNVKDFTSQGQARVLQQAIAQLGIEPYALFGNDSGGWIARELALIESERVTRLVLTNTEIPGHRPPWVWLYQWLARLTGGGFLFRRLLKLRRWRRSGMGFGGCFEDLDLIDGEFGEEFLWPLIRSRGCMSRALTFLRHMSFPRMDEFRELHSRLKMPVAFIWGSADPTFPESLAREMASQFPNVAGFISIPNAKLFMHEERPDAVANQVIDFLRIEQPRRDARITSPART